MKNAPGLDETHDPVQQSWVAEANVADCDFPIQNLPYGRFRRRGHREAWRVGVAIGDEVLDLREAARAVVWPTDIAALLSLMADGELNSFMAVSRRQRQALRAALSKALSAGSPDEPALRTCLVSQQHVEHSVPCRIGDFTDFYVGIHHATAVGRLFRPDSPLLPNYRWIPIGYHGRSSSIVVSGEPIPRPVGQRQPQGDSPPLFGPSRRLDHELELGVYVGAGNVRGCPIPIGDAEDHIFGFCLLNDWSARDIQAWEYQPLGPFLSKNFATTVSPWIVTLEALQPFRVPHGRSAGVPPPLPYLDSDDDRARGGFDITVEAYLQTAAMRSRQMPAERIGSTNLRDAAYWTFGQLLAHHTVGGCNLQTGDLLGSGTLSGPRDTAAGSLLELTLGGARPLTLASGEERSFLEDGDTVILKGHCSRDGVRRIGFGHCAGTVTASGMRNDLEFP